MRMTFFILMMILFIFSSGNLLAAVTIQDDTVKVTAIAELPLIDGIGDDNCWNDCKWQYIDQVWIEYGQTLDSVDFSGRYKIAWSPSTNVLYFLVEIVDDVFVDGYVYDSNPSVGGGYPDYDIVEVFIDHNKSGGLHVFDGTGNTGQLWGTNAENAFSYHIATEVLPEGQVTYNKVVCDIAGESWDNDYIPNYADHFPNFALQQSEGKFTWEFSMHVYDDSYEASNPAASRVVLKAGDLMGLSIAYCDNDDPNEEPKQRDNFIGSVWVPEDAKNDHWKNSDFFGTIHLIGEPTGVEENCTTSPSNFKIYPNPSDGILNFQLNLFIGNSSVIRLFNIRGQKVLEINPPTNHASFSNKIILNHLPDGIYFLTAEMNHQIITRKITIVKN
jgi:hypothetical protein